MNVSESNAYTRVGEMRSGGLVIHLCAYDGVIEDKLMMSRNGMKVSDI